MGSARSMFRLVSDQWMPLCQGLPGGWAGSLAVYNGDLYLSGQCTPAQGNVGKDIMRWDGTGYHALGSGIQYSLGNNYTFCTPVLTVHAGLLWVHSGCYYAGGVPAAGMATWDGTQWCGVPGDLTSHGGGAVRVAFYQDTLFATLYGDSADGVFVNRLAKFIGESYFDTCSGPVGISEPDIATQAFQPRLEYLGDDQWVIAGLEDGQYELELFDAVGRLLFRTGSRVADGRTEIFHTHSIALGTYVVRAASTMPGKRTAGIKLLIER
jgi:hypothetical protein